MSIRSQFYSIPQVLNPIASPEVDVFPVFDPGSDTMKVTQRFASEWVHQDRFLREVDRRARRRKSFLQKPPMKLYQLPDGKSLEVPDGGRRLVFTKSAIDPAPHKKAEVLNEVSWEWKNGYLKPSDATYSYDQIRLLKSKKPSSKKTKKKKTMFFKSLSGKIAETPIVRIQRTFNLHRYSVGESIRVVRELNTGDVPLWKMQEGDIRLITNHIDRLSKAIKNDLYPGMSLEADLDEAVRVELRQVFKDVASYSRLLRNRWKKRSSNRELQRRIMEDAVAFSRTLDILKTEAVCRLKVFHADKIFNYLDDLIERFNLRYDQPYQIRRDNKGFINETDLVSRLRKYLYLPENFQASEEELTDLERQMVQRMDRVRTHLEPLLDISYDEFRAVFIMRLKRFPLSIEAIGHFNRIRRFIRRNQRFTYDSSGDRYRRAELDEAHLYRFFAMYYYPAKIQNRLKTLSQNAMKFAELGYFVTGLSSECNGYFLQKKNGALGVTFELEVMEKFSEIDGVRIVAIGESFEKKDGTQEIDLLIEIDGDVPGEPLRFFVEIKSGKASIPLPQLSSYFSAVNVSPATPAVLYLPSRAMRQASSGVVPLHGRHVAYIPYGGLMMMSIQRMRELHTLFFSSNMFAESED